MNSLRKNEVVDFADALQVAEQRLRAHGHRVTDARRLVLATLLASECAATQDELSKTLERSKFEVDRVTVYRVLEWLVENRLAHRISGDSRAWQFNALMVEKNEHGHFACVGCEKVYCLEEPESAVKVSVPDGFQIEESELLIRGRCSNCSRAHR